ncbi:MAG TPA: hypothetical protein VFH91_06035 [Pyrinomonadaceae bacterium]|nr:hypothetical protein [Pyrinomonadaceae bacterium]
MPVENDTDDDKHLDSGGTEGMRRVLVFLVVLGLLVVTGTLISADAQSRQVREIGFEKPHIVEMNTTTLNEL